MKGCNMLWYNMSPHVLQPGEASDMAMAMASALKGLSSVSKARHLPLVSREWGLFERASIGIL